MTSNRNDNQAGRQAKNNGSTAPTLRVSWDADGEPTEVDLDFTSKE